MDYNKQIDEFVHYFKSNEKDESDFKIGVEIEHFIIDKDTLETVSYYGKDGVEETLKELEAQGWKGDYEGEYLLGLSQEDKYITLEPASQLEFSADPKVDIHSIESEYLGFLHEIIPILEKKNQALINIGYHPVTKIEEITKIPKKRYEYMYEYFKSKGIYAHNMMKGTAALQIAIDYSSEDDYIKKFKVANGLAPVLYAIFDNGYYFEGSEWEKYNLRSVIWENCDDDRSGIVPGTFDDNYGYEKYAKYILNVPPIFMDKNGSVYPTGKKLVREIFDPEDYSIQEMEHILTMVFPDVRAKKFIEIRMMDAVPYPLNIAAVAFIKGLFYNKENLNKVYELVKNINMNDIGKSKKSIQEKGLDGDLKGEKIWEIGKNLVKLAKKGLGTKDIKYIEPLENMLNEKVNPYEITNQKRELGKKESIRWCILNDKV